jgi:signal transduction histidine kinase/CheY-like chemotaxis protein
MTAASSAQPVGEAKGDASHDPRRAGASTGRRNGERERDDEVPRFGVLSAPSGIRRGRGGPGGSALEGPPAGGYKRWVLVRSRSLVAFVGAVAMVGAITALKLGLPALGQRLPFFLYFMAVLAASLWGRWPAGAFSSLLAALAVNVTFLGSRGTPSLSWVALGQTGAFLVECTALIALTERLHVALAEQRASAREAETRALQLRDLLEQAPMPVSLMRGPDHVYELNNAAARTVMGGRDVIGRPVREALPGIADADVARLDAAYRGNLTRAERQPIRADWDGTGEPYTRYFDGTWAPYRGLGGEVAGVLGIAIDVTDRVDLLERERAARERAEEANRAKDEFLGMVSHELRTPLNAMLGWARLLKAGALPDAKRATALEVIERNAVAQAQLIDDLLDVSRIIAGKLRLESRPVDFAAAVGASAEALRPAAEAKALRFEADLDPSAGPLVGDPMRLQQVAWNLLSNAVKFTPRGGHVRARLARRGAHVELRVEDTGEGVPPAFLPHVFERFRQQDGSTTRRHGGLGLGLAIVKHLVELHGGRVWVESEGEGKGSAFTVELPIAQAPQGEAPAPDRARSADCPPELTGVRVLVVDDDPDARDLMASALSRCGAAVRTAASTADALAEVRRECPDAIVSDIGMPGEDGYAFVRRVRALPPGEGGATPAAALTAYASASDRRAALEAGFQMHVAKPVEPADLLATVAALVALNRPAA